MAELKSTIKIDIDGAQKFLDTTKQIEQELVQIEKVLKKDGFKGNERDLRNAAKAYRTEMIKAVKEVQVAEKKRVDELKRGTVSVAKIAKGVVFGGGARDLFRSTIQGLTDLIEKNKNADASIGRLSKTIGNVKSSAATLGVGFLRLISGPLTGLINGFEYLTTALTGYNFEQARSLALLNEQNVAFNEEADALIKGTEALDARSESLKKLNETSNVNSELSLTASIEEIKLFKELTNLQNKFNNATGDRSALVEQINRKNAEYSSLVKKTQEDLLKISKQELEVKKELGTISEAESRKLDGILKTEQKRSEELERQNKLRQEGFDKIKRDSDSLGQAQQDIQAQLSKAVSEGRVAEAKELLKVLEDIDAAQKEVTDKLKQDEKTLAELVIQRTAENKTVLEQLNIIDKVETKIATAFSDVGFFTQFNLERLLEGVSPEKIDKFRDKFKDLIDFDPFGGGELFSVFQGNLDLTKEELDKLINALNDPNVNLFKTMTELGVKSPFLESLIDDLQTSNEVLNATKDSVAKLEKQIAESGIAASDQAKKNAEQREAIAQEIASKTLEIETKSAQAVVELLRDNADVLSQFGELTIIDAFLAKEAEFDLANQNLIDTINDSVNTLNKFTGENVLDVILTKGSESIQLLNEDLATANTALVEAVTEGVLKLKLAREQQNKELESLGRDFTKQALADFAKRFQDEEELLTISLEEKNQLIRNAEAELEADRNRFNNNALREDRDYNDSEIAQVNAHINNIVKLEDERFAIEQRLRVGAFVQELQDIQRRGGDVEVEMKKFQLAEAELTYQHWQNIIAITEKGAIETKDAGLKMFLTPEQIVEIGTRVAEAVNSVIVAYNSLQDTLMQKAIDQLTTQIDIIDTAIANSVANMDKLESDLEGKRSGRRDAVLRGIEMEKRRQAELTEKKIRLEEELRRKEKEASDARKAAAISQAIINGALAITSIWSQAGTLGPIAGPIVAGIETAAIAVVTGLQIAEIESQEFADGGMLHGPSHAQGGIPFSINGQSGFEAEGGEAIMSRRTVQQFGPELNAMQIATGSKPLFADGGMIPNFSAVSNALNGNQIQQFEALAQQPIYVSVTDIDNVNAKRAKVTNITNI